MHTASGEDYYDNMVKLCKPKNQVLDRIFFLENRVKDLEKENTSLRKQCGIKKLVFNKHLGTMCEE
jgi:cell shape-determining protein MreC